MPLYKSPLYKSPVGHYLPIPHAKNRFDNVLRNGYTIGVNRYPHISLFNVVQRVVTDASVLELL